MAGSDIAVDRAGNAPRQRARGSFAGTQVVTPLPKRPQPFVERETTTLRSSLQPSDEDRVTRSALT